MLRKCRTCKYCSLLGRDVLKPCSSVTTIQRKVLPESTLMKEAKCCFEMSAFFQKTGVMSQKEVSAPFNHLHGVTSQKAVGVPFSHLHGVTSQKAVGVPFSRLRKSLKIWHEIFMNIYMKVGFSVTVTNDDHTYGLEMSEQNMPSSSLILSDINPSCSYCANNNNNYYNNLFTHLLTAIELSHSGSSPYISTDKQIRIKYT